MTNKRGKRGYTNMLHYSRNGMTAILVTLLLCVMIVTACSTGESNTKGDSESSENVSPTPVDKESALKKVTIIHSLPDDSLDPHNAWIALRAGSNIDSPTTR